MGWGGRKGVIDIAPTPDSGSLGSSQSLLSRMLSSSSPGLTPLPSSFELAGTENFTRALLRGRTVNAWLPRPGTPSNTWRFPYILSMAQIWGWGQPSGQTLEAEGGHLLSYSPPTSNWYRPFSEKGGIKS